MYKRKRSAHPGQPCSSGCYTDQRVDVGMGAQGNAPMCRGLGCVPGSMSRRRRAQLASYPSTARGGKTCPDGSSYPADVPCPPSGGSSGGSSGGGGGSTLSYPIYFSGGQADWCAGRPDLCSQGVPGESYASQASRMQRRRASVDGHYRSVPGSKHGPVWSRGSSPGETWIATEGDDADIWIDGYGRG